MRSFLSSSLHLVSVSLLVAAVAPACGSVVPSTTSAGCLPVDADIAANGDGLGQAVAHGTAIGDSLSCSFCELGAVVLASPVYNALSIRPGARADSAGTCSTPGASNLTVIGQVTLPSVAPGTYHGVVGPVGAASCSENTPADVLDLRYYPAGTVIPDCGGLYGPNCPEGCLSSCGIAQGTGSGTGPIVDGGREFCGSCAPRDNVTPTTYSLLDGCTRGSATSGSWTVTLTSVTPLEGDSGTTSGLRSLAAHGTFTATLVNTSSANESATLSLTF